MLCFDNQLELKLFKIDLTDFSVEKIETPFHASLREARIFYFKNSLYVLYGSTYVNNQTIPSVKKYKYSAIQYIFDSETETSEIQPTISNINTTK